MNSKLKPKTDGALLADLYQLTMLQGYFDNDMREEAVFELFVRRLPDTRNFLLAAGLQQAVQYLESLSFTEEDIDSLAQTELFSVEFLDSLRTLRFTGDVDAVPEGTIVFENEPLLRVVAPLPQAQLVESRLINILHYQTLVASKAARCVLACPDKLLVDFGMRRAHGAEAAVFAARASYLAGFAGTSTIVAKPLFGVPIFGTMAHSFVETHATEAESFAHFAASHKGNVVLLIDTFDTLRGARRVVELAHKLPAGNIHSVRLDSGDLGALAVGVREIFDAAGFPEMQIFASGGLDEYALDALARQNAPIDGFGIGTSLDVSNDCPALDVVYKLQEYAGTPRRKRSAHKQTWPGRKQVFRGRDDRGHFNGDVLTLAGEPQAGEPLLLPVMRSGAKITELPALNAARDHAARELDSLPVALRSLRERTEYEVRVAPAVAALAASVDAQFD